MQDLGVVTPDELRAAGQQPLLRVEIWIDPDWIDLCDLGGENYVQDFNISLGGASMTPNPVEGKWSVRLFNAGGVFHPEHPTSAYRDYLRTERRVRISVGAMYGGVPVYWTRITGYMDVPKFSSPEMIVTISGGDYMKRLRETELRRPNNYWGNLQAYNSFDSEGLVGAEIYTEADAMDTLLEANNVANWATTNCTFVWIADVGGGSAFVGRYTSAVNWSYVRNPNVCNVVAGTQYVCTFRARRVVGTSIANVWIAQDIGGTLVPFPVLIEINNDVWTTYTFYFTALVNGPLIFTLNVVLSGQEYRIDQISIYAFTPYWERYYELNGGFAPPATGPYYVTLDSGTGAIPCWQGEGDEDWKYEADQELGPDPPAHPAKIVYFNLNKTVPAGGAGTVPGVDNLIIYYFTATSVVCVIARLLFYAGVCDPITDDPYANEGDALARIVAQAPIYVDPEIIIDKVWFEAGTSCLETIKKICERCNYRFYFDHNGYPIFRPTPTAGIALFEFIDPKNIASISTYQDQSEIKNRIVIKGLKQSDTVSKEESMPSYLTGEASDAGSIGTYGERTMTINNHLFQDNIDDITGVTVGGAGAGEFEVAGDLTARYLAAGILIVTGSTNNDGTYTISAAGSTFAAGTTTIPVDEAVAAVADGTIHTQTAIDAISTSLLAEYRDPKWYSDLRIPFNPVPLELGDNIQWEERLSHNLADIRQTGIIRDIKIDKYSTTYKCVYT